MRTVKTTTLVIVVLVVSIPALTGGAAAQSADLSNGSINIDFNNDGESEELNNQTVIYQFPGGLIMESVEHRDGSTFVTLVAPEGSGNQRAAVSELVSEGEFERTSTTVPDGGSRTVELPVQNAEVSVVTENKGYVWDGGGVDIYDEPTRDLITIALIVGATASLITILAAYGRLARKHETQYKDLLDDEDIKINEDYETWKDRAAAWYERRTKSKVTTSAGILLIVYSVTAAVGVVPAPGQLWSDALSQNMRFGLAGGFGASIVVYPAAERIVKKIYQPDKEFIIDFDAKDAFESAAGAGLRVVGVYSASPRLISEVDVDGSPTSMMSSGGRVYLMRDFDPESNSAEASPPELKDDIELTVNADNIQSNRERLEQYIDIATKTLSVMPSVTKIAEFDSVAQVDSSIREDMSLGEDNDGLIGVVERAVEGTEYEDIYATDGEEEPDGEPEREPGEDDDSPANPGGEES